MQDCYVLWNYNGWFLWSDSETAATVSANETTTLVEDISGIFIFDKK